MGIRRSDGSQLFDTFYTTKTGGLGLGLSFSRSIVTRHGGRLSAEPAPIGAIFRFTLPAAGSGA